MVRAQRVASPLHHMGAYRVVRASACLGLLAGVHALAPPPSATAQDGRGPRERAAHGRAVDLLPPSAQAVSRLTPRNTIMDLMSGGDAIMASEALAAGDAMHLAVADDLHETRTKARAVFQGFLRGRNIPTIDGGSGGPGIVTILLIAVGVGILCCCCGGICITGLATGVVVGAAIALENKIVLEIHKARKELEESMPDALIKHVDSLEFRAKCQQTFDAHDEKKTGVLDLQELRGAVASEYGPGVQTNALFVKAFSASSGQVKFEEFHEIMRFFEFLRYDQNRGSSTDTRNYDPDPRIQEVFT